MESDNLLLTPMKPGAGIKLLLTSLLGIAIFFIPVELGGRSTIVVDHLAGLVMTQRPLATGLILLLIGYGAVMPLLDGRWRARPIDRLLSLFKLLGLGVALIYVTGIGPTWLMTPDRLPFLFDKLAMSVGLIVPIGAMALTFLLGFGLLELIGVLMQPVMRPLWRTPGHSAIDAVASFVGSYSVGLLITNRVFLADKYTVREAVIIATGFSTVSAAFMIIVAKTLGLMAQWNFYFWSTLVITFIITAILARVPPITTMAHEGDTDEPLPAGQRHWQAAMAAGLAQSSQAEPLLSQLRDNLRDGLHMAAAVVPTILSVGLLGLLLAQHTPPVRSDWLAALAAHLAARSGRAVGYRQGALGRPGRDVPAGHPAQGCRAAGALCRGRGLGQLGALFLGLYPLHPGHPDPGECGTTGGDLAAAYPAWHCAGCALWPPCHCTRLAGLKARRGSRISTLTETLNREVCLPVYLIYRPPLQH